MNAIRIIPKFKYVEYTNKKLYTSNNIDKEKLSEYSEFAIASLTKLFTMFTILILQQNKLLDINDSIDKYIKSNKNNNFKTITIFHLMGHTSGMKRDGDNYKLQSIKFKNSQEVVNTFISEKLFTLTKGQFNYSNIGFIILGAIIEKITNKPYYEAFKKYIFDPLKMNNTRIGQTNITLYDSNQKKITGKKLNERYFASSSGSYHSCIYDLIIFGKKCMSLLDSKSTKIIKSLYVYYYDPIKKNHWYSHVGSIYGAEAHILFCFNENYKFKNITIKLETIKS